MWPKLLQQLIPQLIDLLPYRKQIVPAADKLLSANAGQAAALAAIAEDLRGGLRDINSANARREAALAAMAEDVRRNLGDISSANAGLSRQIDGLTATVTPIRARLASADSKLTQMDTRLTLTAETAEQSRSATVALGQSFVGMDREIRSLRSLLVGTLVLLVLVALMLGWLLLTRVR